MHKKLNQKSLIDKHLSMIETPVFPSELLGVEDAEKKDVHCYVYTLKYVTSKHPVTG